MSRAAQCEECLHFDHKRIDAGQRSPCTKGHKPRFYLPPTMMRAIYLDYGWRRRCEDFEQKGQT